MSLFRRGRPLPLPIPTPAVAVLIRVPVILGPLTRRPASLENPGAIYENAARLHEIVPMTNYQTELLERYGAR